MGYYTDFSLKIIKAGDLSRIPFNDDLVISNPNDNPCIDKILRNLGYANMKWYDYDEDMIAFSKANPEYVFELHGEGENFPDIWTRVYFRGEFIYEWVLEYNEPVWRTLIPVNVRIANLLRKE